MFELPGKIAVVTGAGSGIGAAIATLFAKQQARVVVLDVDEAAARRTTASIVDAGGIAEARACDVANAGSVSDVFAAVDASTSS